MKINPDYTIEDLATEFSHHFPGLKLEFYNEAHSAGQNSGPATELDHSLKLRDINSNMGEGELGLNPQMTVAELEKLFRDRFGLNMQVFRRSNQLWLQTSKTDNWTLEVQNRKGLHSVQE